MIDSVTHAAATPDVVLPFAALGLKDDEYARIVDILGRRPTLCELAMYSVMWSEHCSYKSSKRHLRQFAERIPLQAKDILLVGMGENAGVVDVGRGFRSHVQGGVAQPPELRRALPGCGYGRRWHRARHLDDGRATGRGDGLAAVRPCIERPTRCGCYPVLSPASVVTAIALGCRTSVARSCSTRRTSATRW